MFRDRHSEQTRIDLREAVSLFRPALIMILLLLVACERDQPGTDSEPVISGTIGVSGTAAVSGAQLPRFSALTLEGDSLRSADLQGQVTLINFWATWCAPCIVETPELVGLQEEWKDRPFRIVGVSQDTEGFDVVRPFVEDFQVNYPQILDDGRLGDAFGGVVALPTTYLVDAEGTIRRRYVGMVPFEDARAEIEALLQAVEDPQE